MPMVQDILRHHPSAQIDWVVEEAYVSLVQQVHGVASVIPVAMRRWRKSLFQRATRAEISAFRQRLKSQSYDYVFDTQGLFKTGLLMGWTKLAPGGKKFGLGNASEGSGYEGISRIFHTDSVKLPPRTHAVARARLVAAAALGYAIDNRADFGLPPAHDNADNAPAWLPSTRYAVFFHGTARAGKKWPLENWRAIAQDLAQKNYRLLLPWGSDDELHTAKQIAAGFDHAQVLPKLPLVEAITLARRAALVIGVDTGLTHIAAAYCRPTIELYCDSARWKTEGNWSSRIINLGQAGAPPGVAEVLAAIEQLRQQSETAPEAA